MLSSRVCITCDYLLQFRSIVRLLGAVPAAKSAPPRPVRRIRGIEPIDKAEYFVDWKQIFVQAGNGGNGVCSFLSLPMTEYAGPDGGDGGNGGHVVFQASTSQKSLNHMSSRYRGQHGESGRSKNCHGKCAEHTVIKVPVGTLFRDENQNPVIELKKDNEKFIAARGGAGGRGNAFFLSNENRAPMVKENGGMGEAKTYVVEMRTIAHVGLVGFPNAGKSSLLRSISRARPKVASYPFTTLQPYVGILEYEDYEQIAVADIPGIIPDAHKNRGLGIEFLRHIERCICLLYVIDLSQPEPWLQLEHLRYELDQYMPGLVERPCAVVGNKIDLEEARKNLPLFINEVEKYCLESGTNALPVFPVSAMKGSQLTALLMHIRELYDFYHKKADVEDSEDE
ncbi:hypothetical protein RvY_06612 [Ramazzottius varieornatus]|uniref:OBG-type G domain-containing protein n=1 Tax=Ramazzottius varieornatus TaxID=947166 RepID=A0A1D1V7W0_RAMVA|nr:hypothetical protein RvY_06612 [Ramazzottius varieornatus]